MFNKATSSIEVEHTQVRRLEGSHVNKAASSIEVEQTQVRRLEGSHVNRQPAV